MKTIYCAYNKELLKEEKLIIKKNYLRNKGGKMTKKLMISLFASVLFISCANNTPTNTNEEAVAEIKEVTVANFDEMAPDLVGQTVTITGTINHVCQHGGKKLFLVEEGTEASIKITTSEEMAAFNTDLTGNKITVNGIVEALIIDEEYLMAWENELKVGNSEELGDGHGVGKGEAADMGEHIAATESIANYRKQIAESGSDHLAFYSIVCNNYEVIQAKEREE